MSEQSKKGRQIRLQVSLPDGVLEAIDDYRFATRTPSRAEAVRQLLKVGLAAQPPRRRSR
jgi:metal-responsive CopG/Arc/MetJ family transcriptional regulator